MVPGNHIIAEKLANFHGCKHLQISLDLDTNADSCGSTVMANAGGTSEHGGSNAQQTNGEQRAAGDVVLNPAAHTDACQDQNDTEDFLTESQQLIINPDKEVAESDTHEESVITPTPGLADFGVVTNKHVSQLQPIN
ncbi:hypothetical protein V6N13_043365 [Hibiscus sabdariffa]